MIWSSIYFSLAVELTATGISDLLNVVLPQIFGELLCSLISDLNGISGNVSSIVLKNVISRSCPSERRLNLLGRQ
jgi:hypothetical protein